MEESNCESLYRLRGVLQELCRVMKRKSGQIDGDVIEHNNRYLRGCLRNLAHDYEDLDYMMLQFHDALKDALDEYVNKTD